MAQISKYPVAKDVYEYMFHILHNAVSRLSQKDEIEEFLDDILTPTEKIILAKRMAVFVMLSRGYTYAQIRSVLHVSPPTIADASTTYRYLGKRSKDIVHAINSDEAFTQFLKEVTKQITRTFSSVEKGSGVWKTLSSSIDKSMKKKAF